MPDFKSRLVARIPALEKIGQGRHKPMSMDALSFPESVCTVIYNAFLRTYTLHKDLLTPSEQDEADRILDNIHPGIFARNVPLAVFILALRYTVMDERHIPNTWPSAAYDALARLGLLWLGRLELLMSLLYQFLYVYLYIPLLAPDSRMREFMHRAVHDVVDALRDAKEDILLRTAEADAKYQAVLDAEIAAKKAGEDLLGLAAEDALLAFTSRAGPKQKKPRRIAKAKKKKGVSKKRGSAKRPKASKKKTRQRK